MRSALPFFVVALGFTWLLQLPAVLARAGVLAGGVERFMLPAALGGFGPIVAAIAVAYAESRGEGVRAVFRPMRIWRVGVHWYAIALGLFAVMSVVGTAVYRAFGGEGIDRWFYPPENAQQVSAMFLMPLVEEPGWRGFALPRMQARFGRLPAALLVGVGWAAWHTMMHILQGLNAAAFAAGAVEIVAGSVVFSWLYNRTRGSLVIAVVAHAGAHLDNPFHAIPGSIAPLATTAAAMVVAAILVVVVDRRAWT